MPTRRLYRQVTNELKDEGRGTLHVTVDDQTAAVITNERYAGIRSISEKLYPGRYRVYAQLADNLGRVHEVEVVPRETTTLDLSWTRDQSLVCREDLVALMFANDRQREENEANFAVALAKSVDSPQVAVVSIRAYKGRLAIIATLLSVPARKTIRAAALYIDRGLPPAARIRALAGFLAGDAVGPEIQVLVADGRGNLSRGATQRDQRRSGQAWKWAALGTGAAMIGTGSWLLAIDGDSTCAPVSPPKECPEKYTTKIPGITSLALGAALVGTGLYLWVRGKKKAKRTVAILPLDHGFVLSVAGGF